MMGCNHLFYHPDAFIRVTPEKLGLQCEPLKIATNDKIQLTGWYIQAQTRKPLGTIVHFHGNAENMSTHMFFLLWLTEMGYDLLEFDYRGYGLSSGQPERAGLVEDGRAVLEWAFRHSRSQELFVFGQSLGGAVAIAALKLVEYSQVRAVVLDSTFSSYRDVARRKLGKIWLTWPLQWPLSFLVSDELSPVDDIAEIKLPWLFIHSPGDPVVPFESVTALYEKASEPKEFWQVEEPAHTYAMISENPKYREKLLKYLSSWSDKKRLLRAKKGHPEL